MKKITAMLLEWVIMPVWSWKSFWLERELGHFQYPFPPFLAPWKLMKWAKAKRELLVMRTEAEDHAHAFVFHSREGLEDFLTSKVKEGKRFDEIVREWRENCSQ